MKKSIIIVFGLAIVLIAFLVFKQVIEKKEIVEENITSTQLDNKRENSKIINESNDNGIYPNTDSMVDVKMGAYDLDMQKELCSIKMPSNYRINSSLYMDEKGKQQSMPESNAKVLSEIINDGNIGNSEQIPNTILIEGEGGTYSFAIGKSNIVSAVSEKDYAPGGIDIVSNGTHNAYIHNSINHNYFDIVFVYDINNKWSLVVQYKGDLTNKISLQQFGQELYKTITTIE